MANWQATVNENELQDSNPTPVTIEGQSIVLCKVNGEVSAFANTCPHAGLPLDGGHVSDDGVITCPFHGYTYSVCSGKNTTFETDPQLQTFPVRITDGKVEVQVEA
ncbi:MAG: Rieske (2Fe-2S) protein [Phycisphaeraceae bacterium JB051]